MRYKRPDRKNALSILEAAEKDMKFTLLLEPSNQSGSTIVRNIYESFRKLGDALMVAQGLVSEDHVAPMKELTKLRVNTKRPIFLVDSLRHMRHNINYYGYRPNLNEVHDAISIARTLFKPLMDEIRKRIS